MGTIRILNLAATVDLNYRRIMLHFARLAAVLVCMFAFSNSAKAQEFENCRSGFQKASFGVCVQICPPGFRDADRLCAKPAAYGRGAGHVGMSAFGGKTAIQKCEDENRARGDGGSPAGQPCEMSGLLAYPKCKAGFFAATANICSPSCPPPFNEAGAFCTRPTYSPERVPERVYQRDNVGSEPPVANNPQPASQAEICAQMIPGQVAWSVAGNTQWAPKNVQALCANSTNANATIACFKSEIQRTDNWNIGLANCRAGGPGPQRAQTPAPVQPIAVQPAQPTYQPQPQADASGWRMCANEGSRCQFSGTYLVRYGAGTRFVVAMKANGAECNNVEFTDPAPGTVKQCYVKDGSPAAAPVADQPAPEAPAPDIYARDGDGNSLLHLAVRSRDIAGVNDYVGRGLDVNAGNNQGETPVTMAVDARNTQILFILLGRGGDLNSAVARIVAVNDEQMLRSLIGSYPVRISNEMFDQAVANRAYGIADLGLSYGVDPNHALGVAIQTRNIQLIESSLRVGANPDPALRYAMENGDQQLARTTILQYRANADLALELAVDRSDMSIFELALAQGANPTKALPAAVTRGNEAMVGRLLERNADPSAGLVPAISASNDRLIELMLEKGADPNPAMPVVIRAQNARLVARLLAAKAIAADKLVMSVAGSVGNVEILGMLINAGGDPNSAILYSIEQGHLPAAKFLLETGAKGEHPELIDTAARLANIPMLQLLFDHGAKAENGIWGAVNGGNAAAVDLMIEKGASASDPRLIAFAAEKQNQAVAASLLKAGANPENGIKAAVNVGSAALAEMLIQAGASAADPEYMLKACALVKPDLAAVLLKGGAPKDVMDSSGQPMMVIAVLTWNIDLVKALLENGVDPDAKNTAGDTALHIAANDEASKGYPKFKKRKKDRLPMVQALVDGGADVNAVNAKGKTVLKSLGFGDGDVKKILTAAGAVKKLDNK